jgi:hypothetical protein
MEGSGSYFKLLFQYSREENEENRERVHGVFDPDSKYDPAEFKNKH